MKILPQNTRLYFNYSLVVFLSILLVCCKSHQEKIALVWKDSLAIGIQISQNLAGDATGNLRVVLNSAINSKGIFGDFKAKGGMILFKPLIPLSPGMSYKIFKGNSLIGTLKVPVWKEEAPQVTHIFPESDTLPENQLKLYLQFSRPMRTGQSLDYVYLLGKNGDTLRNVFLNLQPELWDTTGKILTLWLDPGRIKRGLVLNQKLGNPLKSKEGYTLMISQQWKDSHGQKLLKTMPNLSLLASGMSKLLIFPTGR